MTALGACELGAWANNSARAALLEAVLDRVPIPLEIGIAHACGEQVVHSNAAAKVYSTAGSPLDYRREDKFALLPPDGSGWIGPLQIHLRVGEPLVAGGAACESRSDIEPAALQMPTPQLASCLSQMVRATTDSAAAASTAAVRFSESPSASRVAGAASLVEAAADASYRFHTEPAATTDPADGVAEDNDAVADAASAMTASEADHDCEQPLVLAYAKGHRDGSCDDCEEQCTPLAECTLPTRVPAANMTASGVEALALQQELTLYRTVIQQLPMCVVVATSPEGAVRLASAKAVELWGSDPVGCVAEYGSWPGFHEDGRQYAATEWPLARSLLRGEHVNKELVRWRRADGV